jgi:hypothetical protein
MKIIFKKFLITLVIFATLGGFYLYFSYDLRHNPSTPIAYGSSLASSSGEVSPLSSTDDKINGEISFLSTLASLKRIKIDKTLFSNEFFIRLRDNTVAIDPVDAGRINPFAPIQATNPVNNLTTPRLVTNEASVITDKSAVLNGTINVASGVKNIYFEYGLTEVLGSKTAIVKQSLVGTFQKSIAGLTPETKYFYRSAAEINGILVFGEIIPFTTTN